MSKLLAMLTNSISIIRTLFYCVGNVFQYFVELKVLDDKAAMMIKKVPPTLIYEHSY